MFGVLTEYYDKLSVQICAIIVHPRTITVQAITPTGLRGTLAVHVRLLPVQFGTHHMHIKIY